jgi:tetratricopeptide (TPR) repeat protein
MSKIRQATQSLLIAASLAFTPLLAQAAADEVQEASQFYKKGQHDKALERLDAYLNTRKDTQGAKITQARFLKGVILSEQNKTAEAIKIFTALTDEFPELPEPYNNLAVIYAGQGQYDKARQALEMAIRTHPSYATAHENLGDIYAKMASQSYDKALQLDKNNVTAQTKLALVKDLFSQGTKGVKPAKPEPAAKVAQNPAAAKPTEPVKPAEPAKAVEPAKPTKPAEPAKVAEVAKPAEPAKAAEPAKPAEPAKSAEPAKTGASDETAALAAVNDWAKAWSAKNVNAYLAAYAKEFKPVGGESRADWEKTRKARISAAKKIKVDIQDAKVSVADGKATVTFKQAYRSDKVTANARKTLVLEKRGAKWLIVQENVN